MIASGGLPIRSSPAENIGLAASAPPEGFTACAAVETDRLGQDQLLVAERRVQFGEVEGGVAAGRRRGGPGGGGGAGQVAATERLGVDVVRDPGDPRRALAQLPARSPTASTIAAAPSVIGAMSWARSGSATYGGGEQSDVDASTRAATAAISCSVHRPESSPARACNPATTRRPATAARPDTGRAAWSEPDADYPPRPCRSRTRARSRPGRNAVSPTPRRAPTPRPSPRAIR